MMIQTPLLYTDLAEWWPLMSPASEYVEEAGVYRDTILRQRPHTRTVLEIGSGGGSNASHLKQTFQMTLSDLAPAMLAVSQKLNPELPHYKGDMRDMRLGQFFDAVFIHDAIMYMTSEEELLAAIRTAAAHCRPGGMTLFAPDHTRENISFDTSSGGHDGADGRALRYLQWTWDPDPSDTWYFTEFSYLLRQSDGTVRSLYDRHCDGIFPRETWLRLIGAAGLVATTLPYGLSDFTAGSHELFVGFKPPVEI